MKQKTKQEELLAQAMDLIVESGTDLKNLFDQDGLLYGGGIFLDQ